VNDDDLIGEFVGHLLDARGARESTARVYELDARAFRKHLGRAGRTLREATHADVASWLARLGAKGQSPATRARKLTALRVLYRALIATGRTREDPTAPVERPQVPARRRLPRTREEVERLLAAPQGYGPEALRDRAILKVLYHGGLRVRELAGLDVGDFAWPSPSLSVRGARARAVPLPPEAAASVAVYVEAARPHFAARGRGGDALFLPLRGARFTRQGVWKLVHEWSREAGLSPVSPDDLRHAFGAHRLEGGQPPQEVCRLLGHLSRDSMTRYLPPKALAG
jgi:integrase/recombinase XerD